MPPQVTERQYQGQVHESLDHKKAVAAAAR